MELMKLEERLIDSQCDLNERWTKEAMESFPFCPCGDLVLHVSAYLEEKWFEYCRRN